MYSEFALPFCCRGDTVEVDTWVSANGKNGMRRDWHIRDSITGDTILKATRFKSQPLRYIYTINGRTLLAVYV
jgi:hypothetical protein